MITLKILLRYSPVINHRLSIYLGGNSFRLVIKENLCSRNIIFLENDGGVGRTQNVLTVQE